MAAQGRETRRKILTLRYTEGVLSFRNLSFQTTQSWPSSFYFSLQCSLPSFAYWPFINASVSNWSERFYRSNACFTACRKQGPFPGLGNAGGVALFEQPSLSADAARRFTSSSKTQCFTEQNNGDERHKNAPGNGTHAKALSGTSKHTSKIRFRSCNSVSLV